MPVPSRGRWSGRASKGGNPKSEGRRPKEGRIPKAEPEVPRWSLNGSWEHPTSNIEHPTSNGSRRGVGWMLDVRCWMLDVGCSAAALANGAFGFRSSGLFRPSAFGFRISGSLSTSAVAAQQKALPYRTMRQGGLRRRKVLSRLWSRQPRRSGCRHCSRCAGASPCPSGARSASPLLRRW